MCFNCGCGLPDDDMGNEKNITNKTFDEVAEINSMPRKEAMENTLKLLQKELAKQEEKTEQ